MKDMTILFIVLWIYCGFTWAMALFVGVGERNLSFWQTMVLLFAPVTMPIVFIVEVWPRK